MNTLFSTPARRRVWALGATLLLCLCACIAVSVLCDEAPVRTVLCALCFFVCCVALAARDLFPALAARRAVGYALWGGASVALALGGALLYSGAARRLLASLFSAPAVFYTEAMLLRALILLPFTTLACAFFFFPPREVADKLFCYRWVAAGGLFLLLLACKINLSSVGYFHTAFQPESATPYTMPLFGIPRGIRSDEWLVDLPRKLAAEFSDYGKYNEIVRGTKNPSISSSYLYLAYSALSNPLNLGFYLFGSQYGLSFLWSSTLILSFMVSLELSYIISGKTACAHCLAAC